MRDIEFEDLLGVQFAKGGPPEGHNCRSLIAEVRRRAGLEFPEGEWIQDLCERDAEIARRLMSEFVELPEPEPYCVVTFRSTKGWITHLGIVLKDTVRFLHIMTRRGVACERLVKWKDKIDGYYQYHKHHEG